MTLPIRQSELERIHLSNGSRTKRQDEADTSTSCPMGAHQKTKRAYLAFTLSNSTIPLDILSESDFYFVFLN
mgnify:CR=1 FL=1